MGNSQSSQDQENKENLPSGIESDATIDDVEKQEEEDLATEPIQKLFFLLRKPIVDVAAVRDLLNAAGDGGINLNTPDEAPTIPEDADLKDPYIQKLMKRISDKTYLGDYALHFLVGRPSSQNTPELLELVKLFFLKDHQMNARNVLGSTPLHRACAAGNAPMVQELISWGAEVDAVNSMNLTALHLACYAGHADVVRLLLENGAAKHITFKCDYGIAPCDYVLKDEILQLLKTAHRGAKLNASGNASIAPATTTTTSSSA